MIKQKRRFENTGNIFEDFSIMKYENKDIGRQVSNMITSSNKDKINYYENTQVKVNYEIIIYLSDDGSYTNSKLDSYETYEYETLNDALTAIYSIKLLSEKEKALNIYNIEGYAMFTTVRDYSKGNGNKSIIIEDITDNFYRFDNLEINGVRLELEKAQEKAESLEKELEMYKNYIGQFGIDTNKVVEYNDKLNNTK